MTSGSQASALDKEQRVTPGPLRGAGNCATNPHKPAPADEPNAPSSQASALDKERHVTPGPLRGAGNCATNPHKPAPADEPNAPPPQAGDPEENLRSNGDSTSTDFVRSTNGSPAIRSSTRSKCRMSEANTCTSASASPVTVDAATTS